MSAHHWSRWSDDDLMFARPEINRAYQALKDLAEDWEGLPYALVSALATLQAAVDRLEEQDRQAERKKLLEWRAGVPIGKRGSHATDRP